MLVIYLKGSQREIMDTIPHVAESIMIKLLVKQTLASIKGAAKNLGKQALHRSKMGNKCVVCVK